MLNHVSLSINHSGEFLRISEVNATGGTVKASAAIVWYGLSSWVLTNSAFIRLSSPMVNICNLCYQFEDCESRDSRILVSDYS